MMTSIGLSHGGDMKIVPDTMMWVSYAITKDGHRHSVLTRAARARVRLITSAYILNELAHVLTEDFGRSRRFATLACQAVLRLTRIVPVASISRQFLKTDPNDDPIIETALSAKADVIVTADKKLLALGKVQDLEIIDIDEFVLRLPTTKEQ
jgi:uncharacterized protein